MAVRMVIAAVAHIATHIRLSLFPSVYVFDFANYSFFESSHHTSSGCVGALGRKGLEDDCRCGRGIAFFGGQRGHGAGRTADLCRHQ